MRTTSLVAAAALAGAALAVGSWVLLPSRGTSSPSPPPRALTIRASFTPTAAGFADTVTARIEVIADRRTVRSDTVHVVYAVAPLTLLARPVEHRVTRGDVTVVSTTLHVACLSDRCVAETGRAVPTFAPVHADATRRDGGRASASIAWPRLEIDGRVRAADVAAARPPFRVDASPPAVTYRIAPARLATLLDLIAVLFVGAGFALAASAILRRRRGNSAAQPDALRDALALARAARSRPVPDRRSALGLVARLLLPRDRHLARSADDLAWSRRAPTPERLTDLLDDVEREVRQ
ncbi:MAG TPA: hypothetical protein VH210_10585 [Gaiellaceae bacterium]|jgi:hypothetical protein|nr:hypothetical protein [Gaiellaceae bacterium]